MSWVAVDCDGTLIDKETLEAFPGAAEALQSLVEGGHRVSIWTARFNHAKNQEEADHIYAQLKQQLEDNGIPFHDIWTDCAKPDVDVFIGDNLVPFNGDWNLALANALQMLPAKETAEDEAEAEHSSR